MSWFNGFEPIVQTDVPLDQYVWYRLGGPARWLCEPRDEAELADLMRRLREHDIDWRILGAGANVIVRDAGFDGAVIRLAGPAFENIAFDGPVVKAWAGVDFAALIKASLKRNLIGLEVFAGIPGSVGGVVRQNAGGRRGEIGSFVQAARVLNADGSAVTLDANQMGFKYRHTNLDDRIILAADFALREGDGFQAMLRYREIFAEKQRSQPTFAARTAGCIFKNPPQGAPAGRLLDDAGLKGMRVGGAEISTLHANFILAHDDAVAEDVLQLISLAKERVLKTTGVELQPEVDIW